MDETRADERAASSGLVRKRRRVRAKGRGITWKWFLVILAAAALTSLILVCFAGIFENLEDRSYRPKDIERTYHEMQRMKEAAEKQTYSSSGR